MKKKHNKSTGRDYSTDHKYNHATIAERSKRNTARREMEQHLTKVYGKTEAKKKMKGMDVDHKKELRQGGSNAITNLRLVPKSVNRSRNDHVVKREKMSY